jgi:hypothetical protein
MKVVMLFPFPFILGTGAKNDVTSKGPSVRPPLLVQCYRLNASEALNKHVQQKQM